MWAKIISAVTKYGSKAVKWAWANKWELLNMGDLVFRYIKDIWG